MFSLKGKCESMFGSCKSFYEAISEVNAQYETQIKSMPSSDELMMEILGVRPHEIPINRINKN